MDSLKRIVAALALSGLAASQAHGETLKLDEHLPTAARLAGEYKNLEILLADLEKVGPHKPFSDFEIRLPRISCTAVGNPMRTGQLDELGNA